MPSAIGKRVKDFKNRLKEAGGRVLSTVYLTAPAAKALDALKTGGATNSEIVSRALEESARLHPTEEYGQK